MQQDSISLLRAMGCRVHDRNSLDCYGVDIEVDWLDPRHMGPYRYRAFHNSNVIEMNKAIHPAEEPEAIANAVAYLLEYQANYNKQRFLDEFPELKEGKLKKYGLDFTGMDFTGPPLGGLGKAAKSLAKGFADGDVKRITEGKKGEGIGGLLKGVAPMLLGAVTGGAGAAGGAALGSGKAAGLLTAGSGGEIINLTKGAGYNIT
jgi:hypothetical protein